MESVKRQGVPLIELGDAIEEGLPQQHRCRDNLNNVLALVQGGRDIQSTGKMTSYHLSGVVVGSKKIEGN